VSELSEIVEHLVDVWRTKELFVGVGKHPLFNILLATESSKVTLLSTAAIWRERVLVKKKNQPSGHLPNLPEEQMHLIFQKYRAQNLNDIRKLGIPKLTLEYTLTPNCGRGVLL
jgi:hypothetical protein